MALAHVVFTQYYEYQVEIPDELYDEDIEAAEEEAFNLAREKFEEEMYRPIARTAYDDVEIEFE
jgi:hypothetical protein